MPRLPFALLALLGLLPSGALHGDSLGSLPDLNYPDLGPAPLSTGIDAKIGQVVYPTLGFPSIVAHGDTVTVLVRGNHVASPGFTVRLRATRGPVRPEANLTLREEVFDPSWGGYRLRAEIGPSIPPNTYDILVGSTPATVDDQQPNAVRVVESIPDRFRFVHIADSQNGDLRGLLDPGNLNAGNFGPIEILRQELAEIRYYDPIFCVLSGDLLFGIDYEAEYADAYRLWREAGVPVFMVPGNHDGYTTTQVYRSGALSALPRDGLEHWRQTFGPLYYSFDVGSYHFVAVNSYAGSAERREGILYIAPNSGGLIDPAQLAWLERDLAAATANGRQSILFLHHNPKGSENRPAGAYLPNVKFEPSMLVSAMERYARTKQLWEEEPIWQDEPSAKKFFELIASNSVSHVLLGHVHRDRVEKVGNVTFIETTTLASGPDDPRHDYWGYRLLELDSGQLRMLDYEPGHRQSIPAGNLLFRELDNHGDADRAKIRIENGLSRAMDGHLSFFLRWSPRGYRVRGGQILDTHRVGHQAIVRVATSASAGASFTQPTATVVEVEAKGPTAAPPPISMPGCSGSSGGSSGGSTASFLVWFLLVPTLLWWRGRAR